ncbi:uncharacterized protein GLRG_02780 [Colletotrichum graminicola M1.001]|uniref:Uncharacterized protein n=1 Tax=Colletotrichum graminicola (strain M1.001 / M2 / FGSC 10212) TaxID=645133 RepID=E3Q9U8_COLGM|nr:uncharacterized protein GLRG_02780 [Colletotrichum graminicola M1.001]EFQ27636.1 hypothetical protein GLRG_02780 [Colletotrichum graminicola M1.001]
MYKPLKLIGDLDPRQHQIGVVNRENVRRMLASLAMYPMTEFKGMTSQEFQVLVAQARSEADNPAFRVSTAADLNRTRRHTPITGMKANADELNQAYFPM